MEEIEELEQLISIQIDTPAVEELQEMHQRGLLTKMDVEKFIVSIQRYKEAVLSQHEGLDPAVRHALVKSLLSDYQMTVSKLVINIARRDPASRKTMTDPIRGFTGSASEDRRGPSSVIKGIVTREPPCKRE